MKTYIINMPKSIHRKKAMADMLSSLDIEHEFIAAVDGRTLTEEEFVAKTKDPKDFNRSQAGCALSHIDAYKRIIAGDDEFGLILEDDIIITEPNFKQFLIDIVPTLDKDNCTLLTYYWCREGFLELQSNGEDKKLSYDGRDYYNCSSKDVHGIGRSAAYIISKVGAQKMIDFNFPLVAQADSWVVFQRNGAVAAVDCIYPMPITENDQFGSEIDYTRNKLEAFAKKIVTIAVNANFPVITPIIKKKRQKFAQTYKNIKMSK